MKTVKYILILSLIVFTAKFTFAVDSIFPVNKSFASFSVNDSSLLESKKFNLYINQGLIYIKYGKPQELQNGEVVVYNLLGQEVTRKKLDAAIINQIAIPIQNTCYLVRISYSGKIYTQKIIVQSN